MKNISLNNFETVLLTRKVTKKASNEPSLIERNSIYTLNVQNIFQNFLTVNEFSQRSNFKHYSFSVSAKKRLPNFILSRKKLELYSGQKFKCPYMLGVKVI